MWANAHLRRNSYKRYLQQILNTVHSPKCRLWKRKKMTNSSFLNYNSLCIIKIHKVILYTEVYFLISYVSSIWETQDYDCVHLLLTGFYRHLSDQTLDYILYLGLYSVWFSRTFLVFLDRKSVFTWTSHPIKKWPWSFNLITLRGKVWRWQVVWIYLNMWTWS